jgi:hypothetical protein
MKTTAASSVKCVENRTTATPKRYVCLEKNLHSVLAATGLKQLMQSAHPTVNASAMKQSVLLLCIRFRVEPSDPNVLRATT